MIPRTLKYKLRNFNWRANDIYMIFTYPQSIQVYRMCNNITLALPIILEFQGPRAARYVVMFTLHSKVIGPTEPKYTLIYSSRYLLNFEGDNTHTTAEILKPELNTHTLTQYPNLIPIPLWRSRISSRYKIMRNIRRFNTKIVNNIINKVFQ